MNSLPKRHTSRKKGGHTYAPIDMTLNLRSTDAIIETTEKLGALVLAQKIPFQAMQAINGGIANILRIYCPSGGVTQTVQVAGPQVTVNFDKIVEKLSPDEQTILSKAITRLEAEAQSSQS